MTLSDKSSKLILSTALFTLAGSIVFVSGTGTAEGASTTNKIIQTLQGKIKKLQARVTELEDNPVLLPGETGEVGPQGPPGSDVSKYIYRGVITSRDIVFDGTATTLAQGKRFIVAKINSSKISEPGSYELTAHLAGRWSASAPSNSAIQCFFQDEKDYLENVSNQQNLGPRRYGDNISPRGTWNSINLFVTGDTSSTQLSKSPLYLVCATTGSIGDFTGIVKAQVFSIPQTLSFTD
jgi:hypothetical protein